MENYLIIKDHNETYYSYLHKPEKKLFKTYMTVLINQYNVMIADFADAVQSLSSIPISKDLYINLK